jgi:uncharacterized protein YggT (Ycf19 family)
VSLVDFILNLAGMLLWLSWLAIGITAATRPKALSLASTLKRAEPYPPRRWAPLFFLLVLLAGRSVAYWQMARSTGNHGFVDLGAVLLQFRGDDLLLMTLFSFVSFGKVLVCYYMWLLLFAMANGSVPDSDPVQRMVRLQLGWVSRLPVALQFLLPLVGGGLLWLVLQWPFNRLGLFAPVPPSDTVWQQSLIFGLGMYLAWEYLIVGLLLVHWINSYVYLGNSPIWHFLATTGRQLLRPLRGLPLTLGRADFAALAGMLLVLVGGYYGARWVKWLFVHPPL